MTLPLDDPTTLSLLFHLNSEPWLNDEAYRDHGAAGPTSLSSAADGSTVPLPAPASDRALAGLLRRRRSGRQHDPQAVLPLESLSSLLWAAYGVSASAQMDGFEHRVVPSAGGLYPFDVFAFIRRVDGVSDGLYRFDPATVALELRLPGDLFASDLGPSVYAYPFFAGANLFVVLAATFLRTQAKYGPRGYRYLLLEAGHIAQNLCLAAVELGLDSLCVGGFVDSLLNPAMGLDARHAGALYGVAIGVSGGQPVSDHQDP